MWRVCSVWGGAGMWPDGVRLLGAPHQSWHVGREASAAGCAGWRADCCGHLLLEPNRIYEPWNHLLCAVGVARLIVDDDGCTCEAAVR